ncbi:MAG: DUF4418 family protein [Ruminococcus sp.]|nr:DUF4418 family protein [Ruminococcus sp.]
MKKTGTILSIIVAALSLLLTVGVKTFFDACDKKMEMMGKELYMNCHFAEQAVFAAGIALSIIALLALIIPDRRFRAGANGAMAPLAVITALIPKTFIEIMCGSQMDCQTTMIPAVRVISIAIAVIAAAACAVNFIAGKDR